MLDDRQQQVNLSGKQELEMPPFDDALATELAARTSEEIVSAMASMPECSGLDPDKLKGMVWCLVHEALVEFAAGERGNKAISPDGLGKSTNDDQGRPESDTENMPF
jgi:hypothetical protein